MENRLNWNNKKVLIIMPFYFEYEIEIKKELKKMGATVFLINENLYDQGLYHRLLKIYLPKMFERDLWRYYQGMLKNIPAEIDYILVIKGSTLSQQVMEYIKRKFVKAKYIMYQWDSVKANPNALQIFNYFESVLTFDYLDAEQYHWTYRPLFFKEEMCDMTSYNNRMYDMVFAGSLHSRRAYICRQVQEMAEKKKLNFYSYIFTDRLSYLRGKYLKHNSEFQIEKTNIKFHSLNQKEMNDLYNDTKCVIDYKSPEQAGLTMRTIESLGHHCKLITNNENVRKEPFYNKNNILIYNEENVDIPIEFIEQPYEELADGIYYRYSLAGWLDELFEG